MTENVFPTNLLVGTYTRNTEAEGIYRVVGSAVVIAAACDNPSFLATHPSGDVVYAVNEVSDFDGSNTGAVTAFFLRTNGLLDRMNQQPSMGADPCHITVSQSGDYLIVTNYTGGTFISMPLDEDGHLEPFISLTQHNGSSIHPSRQQSAHIHSSLLGFDENCVLVADLGSDQLVQYCVSPEGSINGDPKSFAISPGAGPRLMTSRGDNIYLVNELSNCVTVHRWSDLKEIDRHSTLPDTCKIESIASHIQLSADGRHLYVSNRGFDSIAVFSVEPTLALIQVIPTGGQHPRHFTLSGDGLKLLVANQLSNEIRCFDRNPETGTLNDSGHRLEVPSPTCLLLA